MQNFYLFLFGASRLGEKLKKTPFFEKRARYFLAFEWKDFDVYIVHSSSISSFSKQSFRAR